MPVFWILQRVGHYGRSLQGDGQVQREEVLAEAQRIPGICVNARNAAADQLSLAMEGLLFRCPNTGRLVQGWSAEEIPAEEE